MKNYKNNIINLGCRLNIYEGQVIKSIIKKNNLSDCIIINSCSVTEEAEKKVKYEIRKSKKNFPKKKIIVTGCAAQINPFVYSNLNAVDYVIGNKEKLEEKTWINLQKNKSIQVQNIFADNNVNTNIIDKFDGKSRAYIEIQQGCDHRCTFCIIPFGRGNNRSIPVGIIIDRIKKIVDNGYNEIVLTGVDITDYGKDLPGKPNLFQLVKRILNLVPNLKQIRLSSIDCAEITEEFWTLLNDKRLMPHFHLSLQSGNNLILKRMKRRHNREQAINFCKKTRSIRNDVVFGADFIAGFPTENQSMFEDTLSLIKECELTHLHIFPYSIREGTPASKMPQVSKDIIKKRAKILREEGFSQMKNYLKKQIGKTEYVLIEKMNRKISHGKTQHFTKVEINEKTKIGDIVKCIVTQTNNNSLIAKLI